MKLKLLIAFFTCLVTVLSCQNIYTHTGNGVAGNSGDSGPSNLANIFSPSGLAIDGANSIYIVDQGKACVRKVTSAGIISTIAGTGTSGFSGDGGQALLAQFNSPTGIDRDGNGNIYIADQGNHRIRKIDLFGIVTTIAGTGNAGFSGDGGLAINAELNTPYDVTADGSGNIYISDMFNQRIRMISTSGIISTIAGNGVQGFSGDGGNAVSAQLFNPRGIEKVNAGVLYIADATNDRVRVITPSGIINTLAGIGVGGHSGDGGLATAARICSPTDIAFDINDNVYITEGCGTYVRKIDALGYISTVGGNGTPGYSGDGGLAINSQFTSAKGIVVDIANNIYLADNNGARVRVICASNCLSGINEIIAQNLIHIYPNPVPNILHIETEQYFEVGTEIEIVNTLGQTVLNAQYKNEIDVSSLAQGYYTIKIITPDKQQFHSKFIKE